MRLTYATGYGFCLTLDGTKRPLDLDGDGAMNDDKRMLLQAFNENAGSRLARIAELEAEVKRLTPPSQWATDELDLCWQVLIRDCDEERDKRQQAEQERDEARATIGDMLEALNAPRSRWTSRQLSIQAAKRMAQQLDKWRDDMRKEVERLKAAVVQTVGGEVEGEPTNATNYLQRLRELVKIEEAHTMRMDELHEAERERDEARPRSNGYAYVWNVSTAQMWSLFVAWRRQR